MSSTLRSTAISEDINDEFKFMKLSGRHWSDDEIYACRHVKYYFELLNHNFMVDIQNNNPFKINYLTDIYIKILNQKIERLKTQNDKDDLQNKIKFIENRFTFYLKATPLYYDWIMNFKKENQYKEIVVHEPVDYFKGSEISGDVFDEYKRDELSEKNRSFEQAYAYKCIKQYFEFLDDDFEALGHMIDPYEMDFLTTVYVEILKQKMVRLKIANDKITLGKKIRFMEFTLASSTKAHGWCKRVIEFRKKYG